MQPTFQSAARTAASVITITGTGDHLRPEWLITFTGMHEGSRRSREVMSGLGAIWDLVEA
jgi:hypothetical protein